MRFAIRINNRKKTREFVIIPKNAKIITRRGGIVFTHKGRESLKLRNFRLTTAVSERALRKKRRW